MRKRLLIKNFVTQMLDQEKQMTMSREQLIREVNIPGHHRSSKHNKIPQTRLEDDNMNEIEEDELDVEETDELIEDQYQPLNDGRSTRRSGSLSDDEDTEEEDREHVSLDEQLADTLNNNSSLSSTTARTNLPGIGSLEMDSHRPFAPNSYLMDNGLSLNDDESIFAPSSEPDLFMLERSNPALYYDEYSGATSVPVTTSDSYGLTYCHDDFSLSSTVTSTVTSASELYPLSTVTDTSSPYLISTCVTSDSTMVVPSISHALCGSNNFEQPTQLPTNFMEEPTVHEQPSMTTLTTAVSPTLTTLTSTSGSYDAELRLPVLTNKSAAKPNFDSMNHQNSLFCGAEDNAKEEEAKNKSDSSGKEFQESKLISTTLVDLVNMVPSAINGKLGDCRREALQDFSGSRHITDLDTNEVQVTNLLPDIIDANGQSRSPRKRLSPLDYSGNLMSMAALSPKRIKL
jgi:hypothetical protein